VTLTNQCRFVAVVAIRLTWTRLATSSGIDSESKVNDENDAAFFPDNRKFRADKWREIITAVIMSNEQ
jgi:hypothetical protein